MADKKLRITLVKSPISAVPKRTDSADWLYVKGRRNLI